MADPDDPAAEPGDLLPSTAYAVLAILSVMDEELSPGEIKLRATFALRHFYWSPSVSHIRRELRRLLALGLVEEREIPIGRVRTSQIYQTTAAGEDVLAEWVVDSRSNESVVVKNSILLKVFLGAKASPEAAIAVIDTRIQQVEEAIQEKQWGRRRSAELGLGADLNLRFPMAVSEYILRSLYFEQNNLRQLRDSIVGFDLDEFKKDESRARGPLRHRHDDE
jgi:DNA-binding PadR family transcriptional regulator